MANPSPSERTVGSHRTTCWTQKSTCETIVQVQVITKEITKMSRFIYLEGRRGEPRHLFLHRFFMTNQRR